MILSVMTISTTDWNGMNSQQWQQHATTFFQTTIPENQRYSLCLGETPSTNSTCSCILQEDISMMTMDYPT